LSQRSDVIRCCDEERDCAIPHCSRDEQVTDAGCHYFDLIAGTWTGAIIVAALALGMSDPSQALSPIAPKGAVALLR
jgi:hypothetical protein